MGQVKWVYYRSGTVKSLAAPSKLKLGRHRIGTGGTCRALLRPVQGVSPVRIQIDPSTPWFIWNDGQVKTL